MNLGQLLEKVLPIQLEGKATGGATTTVADSTLPGLYDDDTFKGGLLFIHSTTDGLAPQAEFSVVSAFVESTGTFTLDVALTASVAAGDFYSIADPQFKRVPVLRVVNDCIRNFGMISLVDTSLNSVFNQLEYTLPLALKQYPIDRIEIGDTLNGFSELSDWYVLPAGPGTQGKIVFNRQPHYNTNLPTANGFRIWYRDYHPALSVYSDKVSETIPDKRIIDECKLALAEYLMEKNSDLSEDAMKRLGLLQQKQQESKVEQRINLPPRKVSKFLNIRDWFGSGK